MSTVGPSAEALCDQAAMAARAVEQWAPSRMVEGKATDDPMSMTLAMPADRSG
jgi:hypothetical protein